MEEKKEQKDSKSVRITVYFTKELKNRIDMYWEAKGFVNRSAMLRQAFRVFERIFPLEQENDPRLSFDEQFKNLNQKLDEVMLKVKIITQEEGLLKNQEDQLQLEFDHFNDTVSQFSPETIPQFEKISSELLKLIESTPDKAIKDFVLMDFFRNQGYKESLIWAILVILKDRKKIKLEEGEWKLYG